MNIVIKRGLLILSVTSAIAATFSSSVFAEPAGKQQYYCKGNYGNKDDQGVWDWIFTASSEQEAREQAKEQYKVDGPNSFVSIRECTLEK
ncbi:hypothetical protein QE197_13770 [Arsenophonus nasoniae]|uniref:Uncharacterized protein n=1 Tax=Arsenophonus nasoniae TaxID=638 RepID=D2U1Y4_9GAMM|nr:hypothetical protein [Arsenophonus nasoniae]QBY44566.1 hypothetical protein ArsFIN_31520 [Arsenophonus nasoniae]WGL94435.1 hypothetical protein QE207_11985 [Arsenophonus nasoniae]WGM00778.1 hypothetical protein QE210_13070 [Arsenophonus nasoniae]WGM04813.1 hypothetical protein QE258_14600 [Arsenophonus nasoniae]WGM09913.1 hypothetical protein QE197_13770 [Arsenophonus nasoniae]